MATGRDGFFSSDLDPFGGYTRSLNANQKILDYNATYNDANGVEAEDELNDDTFGGPGPVGKDFNFTGQVSSGRGAVLAEEAHLFAPHPAQSRHVQSFGQPISKSTRSGYESYKEPEYIPKLEASASIWGLPEKKVQDVQPRETSQPSARHVLSLEEVEAAMRAQPAARQAQQSQQSIPQSLTLDQLFGRPSPQPAMPMISQSQQAVASPPIPHAHQPIQILQNPALHPTGTSKSALQTHNRGPSMQLPVMAQHVANLTEQQKEIFLADEAKRAKRNHKILALSKHNGIMTPQDKNFITRIQLQQLMTASGGADEQSTAETQLVEDFYYQVYSQLRGAPRNDPNQPLNQFAQTYLHQTSGRYGNGRRTARGGDNHVQRMEQQVQRAVEAAKLRSKKRQLPTEGSLGKVAFSNSKTPRPLLSFKRLESEANITSKPHKISKEDRKAALLDIENCYSTLMQMEDHERALPPPPTEESNPGAIQKHIEWRERHKILNAQLWEDLKVMEPIQEHSTSTHPFIAILSHAKGKKLIPRIFRHIDEQQRTTMLTIIVLHLDVLDVVRLAYPRVGQPQPPTTVRDAVELFSAAVLPPLFSFVNDAPLSIIAGLLGLIVDRVNIQTIVRTKVGVSVLTMLISRVDILKQVAGPSVQESEWEQFSQVQNQLFDLLEPILPYIFSSESVMSSDDFHIWQFLAALGVGASPEQQQRLVLGVKDRVMETVGVAKTLSPDVSEKKLAEVNLFMRAIGLDVELLG